MDSRWETGRSGHLAVPEPGESRWGLASVEWDAAVDREIERSTLCQGLSKTLDDPSLIEVVAQILEAGRG